MDPTPHLSPTPSDEVLASQAARGTSAPFATLVERFAGQVLSVVERATGDHHLSRDLTQEIWMKVHRALPRFEEGRRFRPWLFAIAMNHVRDHRRKQGRRAQAADIDELPGGPPVLKHDPLRDHQERDAIDVAMARVPELYRAAIQLVDVLGLDYEEAGEALRCSAGTVKSRVHRGRRAFQEAYLGRLPERPRTQNQS